MDVAVARRGHAARVRRARRAARRPPRAVRHRRPVPPARGRSSTTPTCRCPRCYWLELDDAVLGMPFFVMERLSGVVPVQWRGKDPAIFLGRAAPAEIGLQFVDVQTRVHASTGGPPVSSSSARARLRPTPRRPRWIDHWEATTRTRCSSSSRSCATRSAWLRANVACRDARRSATATTGSGTSCSARTGSSTVFDWELAHVSDPVEDIAYAGLPLFRGRNPLLSQLLAPDDVLRALRGADRPARRGRDVPLLDRARPRQGHRVASPRARARSRTGGSATSGSPRWATRCSTCCATSRWRSSSSRRDERRDDDRAGAGRGGRALAGPDRRLVPGRRAHLRRARRRRAPHRSWPARARRPAGGARRRADAERAASWSTRSSASRWPAACSVR